MEIITSSKLEKNKYRGLDKETNQIIESNGFLKHKDGTVVLITTYNEENVATSPIKKDTLCQCTGKIDWRHSLIYENDDIAFATDRNNYIYRVFFKDGSFGVNMLKGGTEDHKGINKFISLESIKSSFIKIVGNKVLKTDYAQKKN